MKNPYYDKADFFQTLSALSLILREAAGGAASLASERLHDPLAFLDTRTQRLVRWPQETLEEFNDRLMTDPRFARLVRRLSGRLREWKGEAQARRLEALLRGTLPEKRRAVKAAWSELSGDMRDLQRDWQKKMDREAEKFFRQIGSNLERQSQVMRSYAVLGLKPGASAETIRDRHHELSRRFHPDRPNGDLKKMQEINEAYTTLSKHGPQTKGEGK